MNTELPNNFTPFKNLTVCGNGFINGRVVIEIHGVPVLFIGSGLVPEVWLSVQKKDATKDEIVWFYIIEKNVITNKALSVENISSGLVIKLNNEKILEVSKQTEDSAEIRFMDLRKLGLNIYGDSSGLLVGSNRLVNNTFENVTTMIGASK